MKPGEQTIIFERLLNGRDVFVYTRELGPLYPVLTGAAACRPFFRPWESQQKGHYFNGSIGIESDLLTLIATGHAQSLCSALAKSRPPRLQGLSWPHSALHHLISNDILSAKATLIERLNDTGHIIGVTTWLHAAAYWSHIFHDQAMTNLCLGNFRTALLDPSLDFLSGPTQLRMWIHLLKDPGDALPYLYETMRGLQYYAPGRKGGDSTSGAWARLAIIFKEHFQDDKWSQYCMKQASVFGQDNTRLALLRATFFCESQTEIKDLKRSPTNNPKTLLDQAFFLHVIANQSNKARECLRKSEKMATTWDIYIRIAESWLRLFNDQEIAETLLSRAHRLAQKENASIEYAAVRHALLDDKLETEMCFLEATVADTNPMHLTHLASLYLDVLGDTPGCLALLRKAENMTETCPDPFKYLCRCAKEWVGQVGDMKAAKRCLSKAIRLAKSPNQRILCATTAIRLFNDIGKARQIMAHPRRPNRPCHP